MYTVKTYTYKNTVFIVKKHANIRIHAHKTYLRARDNERIGAAYGQAGDGVQMTAQIANQLEAMRGSALDFEHRQHRIGTARHQNLPIW